MVWIIRKTDRRRDARNACAYRDPRTGPLCWSALTSEKAARTAAHSADEPVRRSQQLDPSAGKITFTP